MVLNRIKIGCLNCWISSLLMFNHWLKLISGTLPSGKMLLTSSLSSLLIQTQAWCRICPPSVMASVFNLCPFLLACHILSHATAFSIMFLMSDTWRQLLKLWFVLFPQPPPSLQMTRFEICFYWREPQPACISFPYRNWEHAGDF